MDSRNHARLLGGRFLNILGALLVALAVFSGSASAQDTLGSISGTVTDKTGASIPGAKVVIIGDVLSKGRAVNSDAQGNYSFQNIPIGLYSVTISKDGFQTMRQQNVEVKIGSRVTFNPRMEVGQLSEVIEVTDTATQIDVTSSKVATSITAAQFNSLPQTSRTFNSILQQAPGVRSEIKGGSAGVGGFQVDGSSGSENTYFIDGSEVSDVRRGSLGTSAAAPLDFLQEVQVRNGGFEAELGGATGGVINVTSKSGSNAFHGNAFFNWTNSGLNAGDRGYWQRSPLNADKADFFRPKEDDYHIYYPGGSLGGRIIKDKLFFFTGFSPEIEHTDRVINNIAGASPVTRAFKQDISRYYLQNRLDGNLTSKINIYTSWLWSPTRRTGSLPTRDGRIAFPSDINRFGQYGGYTPAQTFSIGGNYAITPKLLVSLRYGYRYLNAKDGNYGLPSDPLLIYNTASSAVGDTLLGTIPAAYQQRSGYRNVLTNFQTIVDNTFRKNFYADASYLATIAGQQHNFKFGYAINKLGNTVKDDFIGGQFTFNWGDTFSRGPIKNAGGPYGYYTWEDGVRHDSGVSSRNQGFYIQDAWRVNRKLTLNLGVRFENEFLPPYRKEVNGIKVANPISFDWGSKVAPRIGAAYDIFGNGRWRLAGSFGIFYDTMKYELARGSFGGDIWFSNVYALNSPDLSKITKGNPGGGGTLITRYDNRTVPINPTTGALDGIDPGIKPTASRDFNVLLDHQLTDRIIVNVRYVRKDLLRTIEDIGVLDADGNENYIIGNPGSGLTRKDPQGIYDGRTPNGNFLVPKAIRQYDAVEFGVRGKIYRSIYLNSSYTWSRLYGNYSGLANSDESGRSDPGVSRAFDLPYYYFDATGSQRTRVGNLGTDRPHTFKLFGSYDLKTKVGITNLGLTQLAYSGTPDSTTVIYQSAPTFPFGRGDLGRTPVYTQTDIQVSHAYRIKDRYEAKFEVQIRNLFNQSTVISRVSQINRNGAILIDPVATAGGFFAPGGFNVFDFVKVGTGSIRYNPIYGLAGASYRAGGGPGTNNSSAFSATLPNFGGYQDFRTIRLGVKFNF